MYFLLLWSFWFSVPPSSATPASAPQPAQEGAPSTPAPPGGEAPPTGVAPPSGSASTPVVPGGLSEYAYKRVIGDGPLSAENLEKAKMGILRFLGGDVFPEQDVICHFVVGASDTRHR